MVEKKSTKGKEKSMRKAVKPAEKKPTTRARKSKPVTDVQSTVELVKPQTEIDQSVERVKSQAETQPPVELVKQQEINRNVSDEKLLFTFDIITAFVALIAYGLFRQALVIPLIILILLWRFVLKRSIATIVSTFLFTLVTSSESFDNPYQYLFLWVLIGVVIVVELYFQVVVPIKRGQSLAPLGVLETGFFYVAGVVISYILQISYCGVSLIEKGVFDLLNVQTQVLECQFQGTNIAVTYIRWIFTSALFWGSLVVALRRINFDPKNLKRLPALFIRALFGVLITMMFAAAIDTFIKIIADEYNLPQIIRVTYSYLYTITTIILASIGASFATKRFTDG